MSSVAKLSIEARNHLMLDHAHALLGTFITSVNYIVPGRWQIRSAIFPNDIDWNLDVVELSFQQAYLQRCRLWTTEPVDERTPRIRQRKKRNSDWSLLGIEHWLELDTNARRALHSERLDDAITATLSDKPNEAFCRVFADAFELGADEDRAYRHVFIEGQPPSDVCTLHVVVAIDDRPAAIASLHRTPENSFLYNVGTHPDHRGRGLARRAIIELLVDDDKVAANAANAYAPSIQAARSSTVWLQCEADSPAERLYHFLGFQMMFEASIIENLGH